MTNVLFSKMTQAKFASITPDAGTFYRVTTESGQDFYLGNQKLNNAADITAAIAALSAEGGAIKTINDTLAVIQGDVNTNDSIKKQIKTAVDAINAIIGTVPTDSNVMAEIAKAQTAATYDDTAVKADIQANTTAIATLNGEGDGSVKKQIDAAFNEFATNMSDDNVVNTFKELVDYCATHSEAAAAMAGDIQANATAISELETFVGELPEGTSAATVIAYINEKVAAVDFSDAIATAKQEAIDAVVGQDTDTADSNTVKGAKKYTDGAVSGLDADVTSAAVEAGKGVQVQVVETAGKVTSVAVTGNYDNSYDAKGAAAGVLGTDSDTAEDVTVKGVKKAVENVAAGLVWNEVE